MKKPCLFFVVLIFLLPAFSSAQEVSLSLGEAVSIALRDNRDIKLKAEDIKKAKAKLAEEHAGLFPELSFTGSWKDVRGFYAKDVAQVSTQTTLKQYLYRGGKVINTIKYSEYGVAVSEALLDKAKLETALSVQKAFYTYLLARQLSGLNKKILDNAKAHLISLEARYNKGEASQSEILNIKKSLSNIEEAYDGSLNQMQSSLSLLKNLLYLEESVNINPEGSFIYEAKDIAYDEAFLKAMKMRPEIRQYEAQEQADKKSIEIAKADTRPSIYASWEYFSNSLTQRTFSPGKGWNDSNTIGLTFSWPVFDGWATKAKVEQAIIDLKETQLTKQKLARDIALELKEAYIALKNSIAAIKTSESDLLVYTDILSVTKQKYTRGIASLLDLDDAVLSFEVSFFNQKQAAYDYIIAGADFDKATGGI